MNTAGRLEELLRGRVVSAAPESPGAPRTVAVAMANNPEVIGCIGRAIDEDLARFALIGPGEEIRRTADDAGVDISAAEILEEADPVAACRSAARLAADGRAHVVMKGLVQTADFVRAILDREFGLLPEGALISHVAVADVESYHKLLFITDAAINVAPGLEEKTELIRNACMIAGSVGIEMPKVACVAPAEKRSDKVASTVDAALIVERFSSSNPPANALVDGPFGLDVALSREAASIKGIESRVAGDADIVLMHGLDSGNVLYKSISVLAHGQMAGVVAGARVPVVLTSRADSEESKFLSLLLALVSAS